MSAILTCSSWIDGNSTPISCPTDCTNGPAALMNDRVLIESTGSEMNLLHPIALHAHPIDPIVDQRDAVLARLLQQIHAQLLAAEPAAAPRMHSGDHVRIETRKPIEDERSIEQQIRPGGLIDKAVRIDRGISGVVGSIGMHAHLARARLRRRSRPRVENRECCPGSP